MTNREYKNRHRRMKQVIKAQERYHQIVKEIRTILQVPNEVATVDAVKATHAKLNDPLFGLAAETARAEQLGDNGRYFIGKFEEMHRALKLPIRGGYQKTIEQVCTEVHKLALEKK